MVIKLSMYVGLHDVYVCNDGCKFRILKGSENDRCL